MLSPVLSLTFPSIDNATWISTPAVRCADHFLRMSKGEASCAVSLDSDWRMTATFLWGKLCNCTFEGPLRCFSLACDRAAQENNEGEVDWSSGRVTMSASKHSLPTRTCYPGYCSFCRTSYRDVGSLAEGPDHVYICYRCAVQCKELIEAQYSRLGISQYATARLLQNSGGFKQVEVVRQSP